MIDDEKINLRMKGSNDKNMGKLIKGCIKNATTKLNIGSIPSNFQSIIYKINHQQAFGCSSRRFSQNKFNISNINDEKQNYNSNNILNKNHNCKGLTSFISKQKRQWIKIKYCPGPGTYDTNNSNNSNNNKCKLIPPREINELSQCTINKLKKIKSQLGQNRGPGYYELKNKANKGCYKGCKSAFKTKVLRDCYINKSITPSPNYYHIEDEKKKNNKEWQNKDQFIYNSNDGPGPGQYNQNIPDFKSLYEKYKVNNVFVMPNKNRLDNVMGTVEQPNMLTYQTKSYFAKYQQPQGTRSPCFMSSTKRVPFELQNSQVQKQLKINNYNKKKKNFHLNVNNDWIY